MNVLLRCARLQEGLTQEQLADILGVSSMSIWRWESGKMPSAFYRLAICAYFKRPPAEFGWPQHARKITDFSLPGRWPQRPHLGSDSNSSMKQMPNDNLHRGGNHIVEH